MNKIFKIVFNAARGKMMVVNEATSSVQTGKKAAVTVAVIGALMSGVAGAAAITETPVDHSYDIDSVSGAIDGNQYKIYAGLNNETVASSSVSVTNASFNTSSGSNWGVFGGSCLWDSTADTTVEENSSVEFKGVSGYIETYGGAAVRGQGINYYSKSSSLTLENVQWQVVSDDYNYYIAGRAFGAGYLGAADNSTMTFEKTNVVVIDAVAGDGKGLIHGGGYLYPGWPNQGKKNVLTVNETNVLVKGDKTVLGRVIGGNLTASTYNSGVAKLGSSNVIVEAGKINLVVGGNSISWFGNVESDESNVSILGGEITGKVIGANIIEVGANDTTDTRSAIGKTSLINIQNATVNDVVGADYVSVTALHSQAKVSAEAESASVTINNAKVTGNIVAGSMVKNTSGQTAVSATVSDKVVLSMTNTDVLSENETVITTDNFVNGQVVDTTAQSAEMTLINVNAPNAKVIASKGTVVIGAQGSGITSIAELSASDASVTLTADGAANDASGGDITQVIKIESGLNEATVKMAEGDLMGAITADISGGEVVSDSITQAVNKKTEALADKVTLAPQMITRIMMNDVRKRMGDLRAAEGTHGVWARYNGGQMAGDGMEADFSMVQVGIDTVPVADAPRFGVAFSYAQTEADDAHGSSDMDSFSLAFYGTKMYDNGMFVDVIGRMATMDTDMVNAGHKGKMDNVALSLSAELGWRFDVTDRFFFEPSVEATYTYTNADTFTMTNGVTYELEATDSLVGRAGFAAGFKCPDNKGDVYVRAAVVHEFMGDVTMNSWNATHVGAPIEADGEDTYFEYAIGAQFNVNKNTYVYADVERTSGAAMDEDWRANVGVRYSF